MEHDITNFGIYIKGKDSYIPLTTINNTNFPEFKHLGNISFVERKNDQLELIIYLQDFNGSSPMAEVRKLALAGANEEINFDVAPIEKEHMYRLSSKNVFTDGAFLFFPVGWNVILAVFLGQPQKESIKFFSNLEMKPAYAALQNLKDAIKAFANHNSLTELLPKWEDIEKQEKEASDYKYVEDVWNKYLDTEKISLQIRYLNQLQMELNGFLNNHPDTSKSSECKERQLEIDTKLPKLEKMI